MRGALWRCRCDCGTEKVLSTARLKRTKSCGCLMRRHQKSGKPGFDTRHGQARSASQKASQLYETWNRARCSREGTSKAWADFTIFKQEMGEKPSPSHVLMRKNPTRPFSKGNCFWATREQVSANLETAVRLTWKGETKTVSEWARHTGLSKGIIRKRLARGWTVEHTLSRTPGPLKRLDLKGERFGRLVVLEDAGNNQHSQSTWRCRCDCGTEKVVSVNSLRTGSTRSCGCLRRGRKVKRRHAPGFFRCSRCGEHRPKADLLPDSNYRCRHCGLPTKGGFNPGRRLWRRAKKRAQQQGIEFTLKEGDVVIPEYCPALGVRLELQTDRDRTPTLDRFEPTKGYTPENTRVISWRANSLKKDGTLDELERLVSWMRSMQDGDA